MTRFVYNTGDNSTVVPLFRIGIYSECIELWASDEVPLKTQKTVDETQPRILSAEQQQTLLKAYVRQIATDIQAVKMYPRNARRKGWEGTVVIKLHILATGTLKEAAIAQTSGFKNQSNQ